MRLPAPSTARRRTAWWPLVLTALLLAWALPPTPAQAAPQPQPRPNREHRHSVHHKRHHSPRLSQQAKRGRYGGGEARLGTLRTWPTVDWSPARAPPPTAPTSSACATAPARTSPPVR
ncbi:hypothetical protein [Streptomyces sp. NPDC001594]|uniref:hypothetical protein n=1 Tax=Streptomyces sp. NPDC001594 TaxID=3364590 RepID=UPI00369F2882